MSLDAASRGGLTTRWLDRDGAAVSWLEAGRGPDALLFLHAFPLHASMWEAALQEWKGQFRILCPVWRGFDGPSRLTGCCPSGTEEWARAGTIPALGPEGVTPALPLLVEDVAAICSVAGIESAIFAGCSLGGYVLLGLLRQHPELVRAAVFCDTRPEPDSAEGRAARLDTNRWLLEVAAGQGPQAARAALAERMLPRLLGATSLSSRPEVAHRVGEWIRHAPVDAVAFANAAMADRPDSRPQLATLRIPVLVMAGEEDILIPPQDTRSFAAQIPGATLRLLPGAGHLAPVEDPAAFGQAMREWMQAHQLLPNRISPD